MRISRKVMALAAVAVLACTGVAFAAIQHYQFKDGNGNVVQSPTSITNGGDVSSGGAPTTGVLTGTLTVQNSPYTVNCPFPAGTTGAATGNVVIFAASNATDNLTIHN